MSPPSVGCTRRVKPRLRSPPPPAPWAGRWAAVPCTERRAPCSPFPHPHNWALPQLPRRCFEGEAAVPVCTWRMPKGEGGACWGVQGTGPGHSGTPFFFSGGPPVGVRWGGGGAGCGRPEDGGVWTVKTVNRPPPQPAHPQYAIYWAPLTRKRRIPRSPGTPTTGLHERGNDPSTDRKQRPDATCEGKNG